MTDTEVEKSRIDSVMEAVKLEPVAFAEALGVSKEYIYMIQGGSRALSKKMISKIEAVFGIEKEYLLGENDTISINPERILATEFKETPTKKHLPKKQNGVPFYDFDVTATITGSYLDIQEKPEYFVDFMPFNDCDAFTRVYGDSMYPKYASGEIIAIKRIHNIEGLLWGEAYLIVTDNHYDDLRTIKLVHPNKDDPDSIILRASNPNFAGDTVIKKKHIIGIFKVKGKTRIDQM